MAILTAPTPSVMAWLLSNECTLTESFLKEGKERCNQLDPIKRLVSAANDKEAKKVKAIFVGADMDFFDQHPYTDDVEDFAKEAEFDGPLKPLTFTEWGGKAVGQNDTMMRKSVDRLIDLVETGDLSGHMFWSWQDMRQYSRIDGEMRDGVLESGIVTEAREPRDVVWMELTRLFALRRHAIEQSADSAGQQPRANPGQGHGTIRGRPLSKQKRSGKARGTYGLQARRMYGCRDVRKPRLVLLTVGFLTSLWCEETCNSAAPAPRRARCI